MLSRLLTRQTLTNSIRPIVKPMTTTKLALDTSLLPNSPIHIHKRWSGHNTMRIEPSNWVWRKYKDMSHFYLLLCGIPCLVISAIIGVRANPELTEIPEGYEPRDWEYHRHPVARFMARYIFFPPEHEHEVKLGVLESESENLLMARLEDKVESVMKFYNDHRTKFFLPRYADLVRTDREQVMYGFQHVRSTENLSLEDAYNPKINPVPTAGYKPDDIS